MQAHCWIGGFQDTFFLVHTGLVGVYSEGGCRGQPLKLTKHDRRDRCMRVVSGSM